MMSEEDEITTETIKSRIRKMIDGEDALQPLNDDEIIKLFRPQGIRITRRAVAKYRDQMQIANSDERKKVL